jgi:tRNA threonylcarbamoyladenosine biosynthesis protein TsaB
VDTSHPEGSVALATDGEARGGRRRFGASSSHLLELGRLIDCLLHENGLSAGDISRIALVQGPGSFTGLRIGLAYVKGLAAALDTEVVTVGTLKLLAMPLLKEGIVCPMVDARKDEVYGALYRGAGDGVVEEIVAPRAQAPEAFLKEVVRHDPLFVGTGAIRYRERVERAGGGAEALFAPEEAALPSTEYLCRIAPGLEPLAREALRSLEPLYVRPSNAVFKTLKPIDPHG